MPIENKQEMERKLENKYSTVISRAKELGGRIEKSHVENNKLFLRVAVANDQIKNKIWDQVKTVDANFTDLSLDIDVDQSLAASATAQKTYTVQPGDTLSEISQRFYGKANQYMKIYNANRDQLNDPDKIQVGQTLKIPE